MLLKNVLKNNNPKKEGSIPQNTGDSALLRSLCTIWGKSILCSLVDKPWMEAGCLLSLQLSQIKEMVFIRQSALEQDVRFFLFPWHSMHSRAHDNWGEEKVAAKDSELIFIFWDSLLRILGLHVYICTALMPIHGMSEKSFTLHSIFSHHKFNSIKTRIVSVYLIFGYDLPGQSFQTCE